jgi:hypothetical protein
LLQYLILDRLGLRPYIDALPGIHSTVQEDRLPFSIAVEALMNAGMDASYMAVGADLGTGIRPAIGKGLVACLYHETGRGGLRYAGDWEGGGWTSVIDLRKLADAIPL